MTIIQFLQDNVWLIILVLIVVFVTIYIIQHNEKPKSKGGNKGGSSSSVYKEKYEKAREEREGLRSKCNQLAKEKRDIEWKYEVLKGEYQRNKEDYGKVVVENQQLTLDLEKLTKEKLGMKSKVDELTRNNAELNKLLGNETASVVTKTATAATSMLIVPKSESKEESANSTKESFQPPTQDNALTEVKQETNASKEDLKVEQSKEESKNEVPKAEPKVESPKERTMYASFPRSAGSRIYFSDLSENRADDFYFELNVSMNSGKATFKPLDFMKIRNYDPAMAAMLTEGVKPNIASTVLGIEPGKAHIEGKDWIIDKLAKIKLA